MEESLRPNLSKILPRPLLHQLARGLPFATAAASAPASADFLIDVKRHDALGADDAGFGIGQAHALATRIAAKLRSGTPAPPAHHVDAVRAQRVLETKSG